MVDFFTADLNFLMTGRKSNESIKQRNCLLKYRFSPLAAFASSNVRPIWWLSPDSTDKSYFLRSHASPGCFAELETKLFISTISISSSENCKCFRFPADKFASEVFMSGEVSRNELSLLLREAPEYTNTFWSRSPFSCVFEGCLAFSPSYVFVFSEASLTDASKRRLCFLKLKISDEDLKYKEFGESSHQLFLSGPSLIIPQIQSTRESTNNHTSQRQSSLFTFTGPQNRWTSIISHLIEYRRASSKINFEISFTNLESS